MKLFIFDTLTNVLDEVCRNDIELRLVYFIRPIQIHSYTHYHYGKIQTPEHEISPDPDSLNKLPFLIGFI